MGVGIEDGGGHMGRIQDPPTRGCMANEFLMLNWISDPETRICCLNAFLPENLSMDFGKPF